MKRIIGITMMVAFALPAWAQPSQTCDPDRSRDFDFWIGEWNVTVNGQQAGTNTIRSVMSGCALIENWTNAAGIEGKSINYYNPALGKWQQYWVSQNGTPLHLTGEYADGKMIMEGETRDQNGDAVMNRITWFDNDDGSVRQLWESSNDAGESWTIAFDGLYKRM